MRLLAVLLSAFILCTAAFAEFSFSPYIMPGENSGSVTSISFESSEGTAKLYKVGGSEAMLVVSGKIVSGKPQISSIISKYYQDTYYPSQSELEALKGFADSFNNSRNAPIQIGMVSYPAEKTCYGQGTFLSMKPCNDMATCMQTASLVCYITGSDGCLVDVLANHILTYKKSIDKLNDAYAKFSGAYSTFSAATAATSLSSMDEAFVSMKSAADEVSVSKLRYPTSKPCLDCLGVCPEARFDYSSLTAGREKVASLKEKVAPLVLMDTMVDKVHLSTQERIAFRVGEEKAVILRPKYESSKAMFGGLKAQAVEARALVADSNFVSVADSFLAKSDSLDMMFSTRKFEGFDTALSAFESSGRSLAAMINNSTSAYRLATDEQDNAADALLEAEWRVNRLSKASIDAYNALADKKNKLDAQVAPPLASSAYLSLAKNFESLSDDAKAYVAASNGAQESVFGVGNAFSRSTIDGAMALASSITPVSFKTRQSFAKFVPPLMVAAVDLTILAIAVVVFAALFYRFRRAFHSKLMISGWVLTLLGFAFLLIIGSVGFYSIVMSTEKFTSFADFMGTVQSSPSAAIIVEETGSAAAIDGMRACADQIESQLKLMGKKASKYYISGTKCTVVRTKPPVAPATNSTNSSNGTMLAYETQTGLSAANCLDSMEDVPVFDLKYSSSSVPPSFTTVVTKQAIIKGNEAYYAKKPMCDIANVLN